MIQFNSQGTIDTGPIGKVPKNCPKSVQNRQKGEFSGRVLVLAPAQSWSHRPSHRRTKPPGRRRTTLCAISARETPGEQARFFRFSQLVTCCDNKVLSGINSVFKSFGRIVGNEWVGELMTTMNCDRRKPGEQVWYPSVSNIRYTFFNLLCWRWCLSLSWPPTCWDLKFDYLAGHGQIFPFNLAARGPIFHFQFQIDGAGRLRPGQDRSQSGFY